MSLKTSISSKKRSIGIAWGSVAGFQPFRGQGSVQFESKIERDFVIRAEHDPSVLSIESQPFSIQYNKNGFVRVYTPDFLVHYRKTNGFVRKSEVFEVKDYRRLGLKLDKWKPKFMAAINYCKHNDYVFKLTHEHKIRDQRWENAILLSRVRSLAYTEADYRCVIDQLREYQISTVIQLSEKCFDQHRQPWGQSFICALIYEGRIHYNADFPFSIKNKIWVPSDE